MSSKIFRLHSISYSLYCTVYFRIAAESSFKHLWIILNVQQYHMCSNNSIFFLPRSINIFKFPVFPPYVHTLQGLICTCDLAVYSVHVTTGTITPSIVLPMLYPVPRPRVQFLSALGEIQYTTTKLKSLLNFI